MKKTKAGNETEKEAAQVMAELTQLDALLTTHGLIVGGVWYSKEGLEQAVKRG